MHDSVGRELELAAAYQEQKCLARAREVQGYPAAFWEQSLVGSGLQGSGRKVTLGLNLSYHIMDI